MRSIEGKVTIAQESRFQLIDREGVAHLFILAPGSGLDSNRLGPLAEVQAQVRVRYKSAPNACAFLAKAVTLL